MSTRYKLSYTCRLFSAHQARVHKLSAVSSTHVCSLALARIHTLCHYVQLGGAELSCHWGKLRASGLPSVSQLPCSAFSPLLSLTHLSLMHTNTGYIQRLRFSVPDCRATLTLRAHGKCINLQLFPLDVVINMVHVYLIPIKEQVGCLALPSLLVWRLFSYVLLCFSVVLTQSGPGCMRVDRSSPLPLSLSILHRK